MKRCTKRKITGNTLTRNTVNSPMAALFVHKHERNGEKEGLVQIFASLSPTLIGVLGVSRFYPRCALDEATWARACGFESRMLFPM